MISLMPMAAEAILWAQRANYPLLWTCLALVAALLLAAAILSMADRWRKRSSTETTLTAGDQLSHFRTLYEQGTLSQEEFEKIRARLAGQLRQELSLNNPPTTLPTSTEELSMPEPPKDGSQPA